MVAEVKSISSPDIIDFKSYRPEDDSCFSFLLDFVVGVKAKEGGDVFSFEVCTPQWLLANHDKSDIVFGKHKIVVFEYDIERIIRRVKEYCGDCTGNTWEEVANKISRIGRWEFEDYRVKG